MEKAVFWIDKYQFSEVHINMNNHKDNDLSISFGVRGQYDNEEGVFELNLNIDIFNENEENNPFVNVNCKGYFMFEQVGSFNDIPEFFYKNSIAILFPYLRSYISIITNQANVPGIMLPTLNLSVLEGDLRDNTIVIN